MTVTSIERKFINGLTKAGLAAQTDGSVVKGEGSVATVAEDGTPTTAGVPKRQQPKRQSKSQRQSGSAKQAGEPTTSLEKSDEPEDAQPEAAKKDAQKPGGSTRSKAQSGQRKGGPQRPKSPSKK